MTETPKEGGILRVVPMTERDLSNNCVCCLSKATLKVEAGQARSWNTLSLCRTCLDRLSFMMTDASMTEFDTSEPYTKTCPCCGFQSVKWNYSFSETWSGTYEFRKDGGCRADVNPERKDHVKITCPVCARSMK